MPVCTPFCVAAVSRSTLMSLFLKTVELDKGLAQVLDVVDATSEVGAGHLILVIRLTRLGFAMTSLLEGL